MSESTDIVTPRLRIVPFTEQFLTPTYVGWLNDIDVVRFSNQRHSVHTLESCGCYWQSYAGTPHYFWAIVERERWLGHIGNMNAYVNLHDQVADLGILIGDKNAWRHGYAREAWTAVCRYLFAHTSIRKITAGTCATNAPMLAVMRATGMVEDGRRVRHTLVDGEEIDIVHAAFFRESEILS